MEIIVNSVDVLSTVSINRISSKIGNQFEKIKRQLRIQFEPNLIQARESKIQTSLKMKKKNAVSVSMAIHIQQ